MKSNGFGVGDEVQASLAVTICETTEVAAEANTASAAFARRGTSATFVNFPAHSLFLLVTCNPAQPPFQLIILYYTSYKQQSPTCDMGNRSTSNWAQPRHHGASGIPLCSSTWTSSPSHIYCIQQTHPDESLWIRWSYSSMFGCSIWAALSLKAELCLPQWTPTRCSSSF